MNKKGNFTPITLVFWIIIFGVVFFMFGAKFLGENSILAVEQNNLTGIEAFLLSNMVLWFILIVVISILAYVYIGGG